MSDVHETSLVDDGAIPPDDFHEHIGRIAEVASYDLEVPTDLDSRLTASAEKLLVPEGWLQEAAAALLAGHVVLQGPPGTGKSSLADALCRAFNVRAIRVTAREDWSAFELIGRQELRVRENGSEEIVPVNGFFTEAAIQCAGDVARHFDDPSAPQATWLFIDELNRAHIDRAFGELFSVLGTDALVGVNLPHTRGASDVLVTPRRFRIIATLNSVDKQFVNSLSQGLRRRFTFLTLDVPAKKAGDELWGSDAEHASQASREFTLVINEARARLARKYSTDSDLGALLAATDAGVRSLFDVVERVRYATDVSADPFLPVGTATLIDTVELYMSRAFLLQQAGEDVTAAIDWAAAVKLAPLFETDLEGSEKLADFALSLPAPFDGRFRRELLRVVAAGSGYV